MFKFFFRIKEDHMCKTPYPDYWYENLEWKCYKCKSYWYLKYDSYGGHFIKRD